jgi:hypothetical protein
VVLEDPAGHGVEAVRPIRDEIRARVLALLRQTGRVTSQPVLSPVCCEPRTRTWVCCAIVPEAEAEAEAVVVVVLPPGLDRAGR